MIRTVLAALISLHAALAAAQTAEPLNFGVLSTESSSALRQHWEPILADMTRRTGLPVKAYFSSDYAGIIEAMRFNKVQIAWLGNKPAIEAVDRANAEVFAQMLYADDSPGYYSLLIVHRDSPLASVEDVFKSGPSLNFGAGDPNSTSGSLVPGYYLFALNGIDPRKQFKHTRSANHEVNFLAVLHRQVDAATVSSEILHRFEMREPARVKEVRVLWRSPFIANDPLAWRKDLAEPVKAKVREFWLAYGQSVEDKARLKPLLAGGFRASTDRQLVPFRQLDLHRDKARIEADPAMPEAQKQSRLTDINRRLDELGRQLAAN